MNLVDTSVETGTIDLFSLPGWDEPTTRMPVFQIPDPQPVTASPPFIPPGRARLPEIVLAGLALLLNVWHLERNGLGNSYYAAAARSMTTSWKAFFYGSLDPGNWITTDKPPGALWLQALSARIFGGTGCACRSGCLGAGGHDASAERHLPRCAPDGRRCRVVRRARCSRPPWLTTAAGGAGRSRWSRWTAIRPDRARRRHAQLAKDPTHHREMARCRPELHAGVIRPDCRRLRHAHRRLFRR